EAVLGLHDAAPGSSPGVLLRFRVGGFRGWGGGSSGFLPAFGFSFLLLLSPRFALGRGGSRLGLQLGLGCADLLGAPLLVADCRWRSESAHIRRRPESWHKFCRRSLGGQNAGR